MEKCPEIQIEKLIEYCDGELSENETKKVEQHIADCQICKANVIALQNSLTLAQNVWENEKDKWRDLKSFEKHTAYKLSIKKLISIAAGIIIIFAISLFWLKQKPNNLKMPVLTAKEIELKAEYAAVAAQLLAVGDMYAAQPGAEEYAAQRYNELIESFPSSPLSEQAKMHLQELLKKEMQ